MRRSSQYQGFGLLIDSEFELPELPPASFAADRPRVVIRTGTVPRIRRLASFSEEIAVNVVGAAFLIRDGCEITVDVRPDADPAAVRVVLLGRIMAFLFRQRGWLPLHASGVVVGGDCVLFSGPAGAGKSTTAAVFHRSGHLVVTDDVGPVRIDAQGNCILQPSRSYVRLREDARAVFDQTGPVAASQADKHRYELNSGITLEDAYPVRCVYVVDYGREIQAQPIPDLEAAALLSRNSFVKHRHMERESLRVHLRDCASIASIVPVRRLVRPRSLLELPALVNFVEEDLATLRKPVQR